MRCNFTVLLAVSLLGIPGIPAAAQATFDWPTGTANVVAYATPEMCLAAVEREARRLRWGEEDTVPVNVHEPAPDALVNIATRCFSKFDVRTLSIPRLEAAIPLALLMGRDTDAALAIDRQLADAHDDSSRQAGVLFAAIRAYTAARPARDGEAQRRLAQLGALGPVAWRAQLSAHEHMAGYARLALNEPLLRQQAMAWLDRTRALNDAQRQDFHSAAIAPQMAYEAAFSWLGDSGTAVVARVLRADAAKALHVADSAIHSPIGELATSLVGGRRYRWGDPSLVRPRRGVVTLIAYVDDRCAPISCYPSYAMLRRLARRFGGSIEIILVAHTVGYFHDDQIPDPRWESVRQREYFLTTLALPGALLVNETPTVRLPDPDRRLVDGVMPNYAAYGLSTGRPGVSTALIVVDAGGRIAFRGEFRLDAERQVERVISMMVTRGRSPE